MSGARRNGAWVVPSVYTAVAFLGGVDIDLRDARFSEREVRIRAFTLLGGVHILVPEDIEVDVAGIGIMGEFEHRETGSDRQTQAQETTPKARKGQGFRRVGVIEAWLKKGLPSPGCNVVIGDTNLVLAR
jgi:hypothetical protein